MDECGSRAPQLPDLTIVRLETIPIRVPLARVYKVPSAA